MFNYEQMVRTACDSLYNMMAMPEDGKAIKKEDAQRFNRIMLSDVRSIYESQMAHAPVYTGIIQGS